MSLLQISEPSTAAPKVAVGIDLGTTNSLAAVKQSDGLTRLITDTKDQAIIPSVVAYHDSGQLCTGRQALARIGAAGWVTFTSIKRYMGLAANELQHCRYDFATSTADNLPRFIAADKRLTAQEISASLLQHLHANIEEREGKVATAVVTVPAYFDDAQRKATQDAARLAGLPLARLLNEPTAAALAYGLDNKGDGYIAVFDLGGGTFDISILKCTDGLIQVLVTAGDTHLGGDDFDRRLLKLALTKLNLDEGLEGLPVSQQQQLLTTTRELKHLLTTQPEAMFDPGALAPGVVVAISATAFHQATQDLTDRCLALTLEALKDADLDGEQLDSLVLVGGSTRMPQIRHALRQALPGTNIYAELDPDTTVAIGAAQLAAQLSGQAQHQTLVDVVPLSLGIETMGGLLEKIIPRNTPIPVMREQLFTTARDGQQKFLLHVLQGERELVADCRSLARFVLKDIPLMPAGAAQLNVRFALDASGVLNVTAREEKSGVEQEIVVESVAGLSQEQIAALLADSYTHAKEDMQARSWQETLLEAEQLQLATQTALKEDKDLLTQEDIQLIESSLQYLARARETGETESLRQASKELAEVTTSFAHKRMERMLKRSLQNRAVDDL